MMEITINVPGLEKLADAIFALAGIKGGVSQPAPQQAQPQFQPVPQPQPIPMQGQMQVPTAAPGFQPMQGMVPMQPPQAQANIQTPGMQVPTTAVTQGYTQDQLAVAAAGLVSQGKQMRLVEILRGFGVNTLVELPKERYGEFATTLRAEGAVI